MGKKGREVSSTMIGELVMKNIKSLDNIAYIRFASVYRDFQDVKDFKRELRGLWNGDCSVDGYKKKRECCRF